jgi:metal-responsive CopG/Arc/MetJ family transcriptional regulator
MSHNPRKFRQPVRLIVSVEAQTVGVIDAVMNAGGNQGHRNRSEFVRQAIERELRRCQSDDFQTSNAREAD